MFFARPAWTCPTGGSLTGRTTSSASSNLTAVPATAHSPTVTSRRGPASSSAWSCWPASNRSTARPSLLSGGRGGVLPHPAGSALEVNRVERLRKRLSALGVRYIYDGETGTLEAAGWTFRRLDKAYIGYRPTDLMPSFHGG